MKRSIKRNMKKNKKNTKNIKKNIKTQKSKKIHHSNRKTFKSRKIRRKMKNTKSNKLKKCNFGLLGAQEDIFPLGKCIKVGGGCNDNVQVPYSPMKPESNIAPSIPGPFVGQPLEPGNTNQWPGSGNVESNYDYYDLNNYEPDIARTIQNGGKHKKGGSVVQHLSYNLGSMYNGLMGTKAPVNPLPYKDQITFLKNT